MAIFGPDYGEDGESGMTELTEPNWPVVKRLQAGMRDWSAERLTQEWRDRHYLDMSTSEWLVALSAEMDRRDLEYHWRRAGRQFGVSEDEMERWVAYVASCGNSDLLEEIYDRFVHSRAND